MKYESDLLSHIGVGLPYWSLPSISRPDTLKFIGRSRQLLVPPIDRDVQFQARFEHGTNIFIGVSTLENFILNDYSESTSLKLTAKEEDFRQYVDEIVTIHVSIIERKIKFYVDGVEIIRLTETLDVSETFYIFIGTSSEYSSTEKELIHLTLREENILFTLPNVSFLDDLQWTNFNQYRIIDQPQISPTELVTTFSPELGKIPENPQVLLTKEYNLYQNPPVWLDGIDITELDTPPNYEYTDESNNLYRRSEYKDLGIEELNPRVKSLYHPRKLEIMTGNDPWIIPYDCTLYFCRIRAKTAPGGSDTVFLLKVNNEPLGGEIVAEEGIYNSDLRSLNLRLTEGDQITVDIISVGLLNPGEDITIQFYYGISDQSDIVRFQEV